MNEGPEGGYTDEDLFIEIQAAGPDGMVTLLRTVQSPLLRTGAGRTLVGREVRVRHTTLDPHYLEDVLVEQWPAEVAEALKPFRPRGRGAFGYRVWSLISGLGVVVGCGGIMLLVPSLCVLIATLIFGPQMVDNFPAWLQPVVVFPASVVAVPLGFWVHFACGYRAETTRAKIEGRTS
ncbi:hypothetical protein E0L36_21510 [Streptomyces sp. AJS327]|nr:hypothetical protein [Streptomyces sp. AJS327]